MPQKKGLGELFGGKEEGTMLIAPGLDVRCGKVAQGPAKVMVQLKELRVRSDSAVAALHSLIDEALIGTEEFKAKVQAL
jgi:hypothetical protein